MLMMVVKIKVPDCQGVDDVEDIDDYFPSIVYQEHSEQQRNWSKQTLFVVRLKMLETQNRQCIVMYHCLNDDAENEGASQRGT